MPPRKPHGKPLPLGLADPEHLYSVAQAAELLHLSPWKVRDLIGKSRLPAIVIDHTHRVRAKDLKEFITAHRNGPKREG